MVEHPILRYADFYDVPRVMVVAFGDQLLLLESPFDPAIDDYPSTYQVYRLPNSATWRSPTPWDTLRESATPLGEVPLTAITFDATLRRSILVSDSRFPS